MAIAKVWVYAEAEDGAPVSSTLELLTEARSLGGTVEAVYAGSDAAALAGALGEHGATRVFATDPGEGLRGPAAAAAIAALVGEHQPDLVLFAQTYDGRDAAGRLSANLDRPVVTNVTGLGADGGAVRAATAIFGGNTIVETELRGPAPALVMVRPKSFAAEPGGGAPAEVVPVAADAGRGGEPRVLERHVEESEGPQLEDAEVVVSGGRGLGAAEHYALVDQLAKLLGAAAGASRAIVDAGWVPYSRQVGQTGKTVKPKVYVAAGISGATQHMVGMKGSDNIIAINKDPEAPIFAIADLGVVGDVHKVLPKLIEALEARR